MKRKITRLAFGLKCGGLGASGYSGSAASISERIPGSSRPPPARDRMACLRSITLVHEQERVATEHGMNVTLPRPCLGLCIPRDLVFLLQPGEKLSGLLQLRSVRPAPEDGLEGNFRTRQFPGDQ